MSILNRFYFVHNKNTDHMLSGNVPELGGTGYGDTYLEIPILLVCNTGASSLHRTSGLCYYSTLENNPVIVFSTSSQDTFRKVLGGAVPGGCYSYFNYNNRPVFEIPPYLYKDYYSFLYNTPCLTSKDKGVLDTWCISDSFNSSGLYTNNYTGDSDYTIDQPYKRPFVDCFTDVKTVVPAPDTEYRKVKGSTIIPDSDTPDQPTQGIPRSHNAYTYYDPYIRDKTALDVTPEDKRVVGDIYAGLWISKKGKRIYVGTPVFKIETKKGTYKTIPVNDEYSFLRYDTGVYTDASKNIVYRSSYSIQSVLLSYNNKSNVTLDFVHETRQYEGASTYDEYRFLAFNFSNRETNNGYYRKDLPAAAGYTYASEEDPEFFNDLEWFDGLNYDPSDKTSASYIGSTLERNMYLRTVSKKSLEVMYHGALNLYFFKNTGVNHVCL